MNDLRLMVALARAKDRFPAMRMTQIICNAVAAPDTHDGSDPFYTTDEQLIAALNDYCSAVHPYPRRARRKSDR